VKSRLDLIEFFLLSQQSSFEHANAAFCVNDYAHMHIKKPAKPLIRRLI